MISQIRSVALTLDFLQVSNVQRPIAIPQYAAGPLSRKVVGGLGFQTHGVHGHNAINVLAARLSRDIEASNTP